MFAVIIAVAAWPLYVWWYEDTFWLMDILMAVWVLLFGLVAYVAFRGAVAGLGSKNWILRVRSDGVMIKFRSYLNAEPQVDDETVVFIHYREIANVNVMKQRHIEPGGNGGEVLLGKRILEFKLRDIDHAASLAGRISDERKDFGKKISARAQFRHWPVTVSDGNIVGIQWRGRSDNLKPNIKKVIALLSGRLRVSETDQGTQRIVDLPPEARSDHIRQMARRGERMAAVKIVLETTGMDLTAAIEHVDALAKEDLDTLDKLGFEDSS